MNLVKRMEFAGSMLGVEGHFFAVVHDDTTGRILNQQFKAARHYQESGHAYRIAVTARFDDECKNGHEITPENTYVSPKNQRGCRECQRLRNVAIWARHKAARQQQEVAR